MVVRAYEVLRTSTAIQEPVLWDRRQPDVTVVQAQTTDWSWMRDRSSTTREDATASPSDTVGVKGKGSRTPADSHDHGRASPAPASRAAREFITDPNALRTVDVELIWTRFTREGLGGFLCSHAADDPTLSVCMVISWPPEHLVYRTAEFPSSGKILHTLIDLFERLRSHRTVVAARSRIEDGRFVGWLSYPDVLTAQDAFYALRAAFLTRGLIVKLHTRDERIPLDWYKGVRRPVMSQAS